MDQLFKQVFNNKVLFRIIFNYVQYKECVNYESYDQILNSSNVYEINLVQLIESKQFKTFDYFFELLFNDQGVIQQKHWYNRINFNYKEDHFPIFRYKQLGLNRFKRYLKYYLSIFECNQHELLRNVVKSGNIEIVNYLFEQYPFLKKYNIIDPTHIYFDLLTTESRKVFNFGNSLEIFNLMVKPSIFDDQKNLLSLLVDYSGIGHFNIYSTLLEKLDILHYTSIIQTSFTQRNLPLAKSIINSTKFQEYVQTFMNGKDKFIQFLFKGACRLNFTFSELYFEILMAYIESVEQSVNYRNILVKKCPKSVLVDVEIKLGNEYYKNQDYIYVFRFGEIGGNDQLIASFIDNFFPNSIEEYKYILNNEQLLFEFYDLEGFRFLAISQYIASYSTDLQFIKYCYHHWFEGYEKKLRGEQKKQEKSGILIKFLLNSSDEISNWFIQNHSHLINSVSLNNTNGPTYTFGGSLERLKQFESFGINYDKELTFRECSKRGYFEIVKYLLPIINVKPFPYMDIVISSALVCSNYNQFETFQYLVKNCPQQKKSSLKSYTDTTLGNKFIHFLLDNDSFIPHKLLNSPNSNIILYSDFQIFKLVFEKQPNLITENIYRFATNCTNFNIFDYIVGNLLSNPGNFDIQKEMERLIVNLVNGNQKKLIYLLGYSKDLFLKYYKITIKKSILSIHKRICHIYYVNKSFALENSIFILQQILLLSSTTVYKDSIDKQQIYLEIIYYSILFKCDLLLSYFETAQLELYSIDKSIINPIKLLEYNNQFKDITQRQFNNNINQYINENKLNFLNSIELKIR